jgi:hypothetical protein
VTGGFAATDRDTTPTVSLVGRGESSTGRVLGIERVGLAARAPHASVRAVDLGETRATWWLVDVLAGVPHDDSQRNATHRLRRECVIND